MAVLNASWSGVEGAALEIMLNPHKYMAECYLEARNVSLGLYTSQTNVKLLP